MSNIPGFMIMSTVSLTAQVVAGRNRPSVPSTMVATVTTMCFRCALRWVQELIYGQTGGHQPTTLILEAIWATTASCSAAIFPSASSKDL
jgi:hypothetical protein